MDTKLLLVILVAGLTLASAELSLFRGEVTSGGAIVSPVQGVVALGLGGGGGTPTRQYLDCNGTSNAVGNLQWNRDSGVISLTISARMRELRLDLSSATEQDEGIYTCMDTVTGDSVSINVTGASLAVVPAEAVVSVRRKSTASLRVHYSAVIAIDASNIVWSDSRNRIFTNSSRHSLEESNEVLTITDTNVNDSGVYMIAISRRVFGSTFLNASTMITLNVHVPPTVKSSPMEIAVLEHEDVTLTCIISGSPEPLVSWEREGADLPVMSRTRTESLESRDATTGIYMVESRYTISRLFASDAGRYRCSASSAEFSTTVQSLYAELTITPRLQLTLMVGSSAQDVPESRLVSVSNGDMITVTCRGSGTLMWSSTSGIDIPSVTLTDGEDIYQLQDITASTQQLVIRSFTTSYQSEYMCSNSDNSESIFLASSFIIYISAPIVYTSPSADVNISAVFFVGSSSISATVWQFNGQLINTDSNSRYSTIQTQTSEILTVHSVDADVLGEYTVIITVGGASGNDSVELTFPVAPSSSVSPTSLTVDEGANAEFNCVASGTMTTQRWVRGEDNTLSSTDQLVLQSVTRSSAGSYVCEVFGQYGGIHRSTATLNVNFPPTIEVRDVMTGQSIIQVFNITSLAGDQGFVYSCQSEGFPVPTVTWSRAGGLPAGVTQRRSNSQLVLEWNRMLEYTDSGLYTCTTTNNIGERTVVLNLLVEEPPVVTSIFATPPVLTTSRSSFSVPNGYTGNILTCSGFAWAPPQIQWIKAIGMPTGETVTNAGEMAFVSAKLEITQFGESDVGNYSCIVRSQDGSEMHIETVSLALNLSPLPTDPPSVPQCMTDSAEVMFQLRVFDVNCSNFIRSVGSDVIASDTRNELLTVVNAECASCLDMANTVSISVTPSCSQDVEGAIVFRGSVTTGSVESTESVFCALDTWIHTSPLMRVNNALHQVDSSCILSSGSSSTECTLPSTTTGESGDVVISMTVLIAACAGGGVLLAVIFAVIIICCCCCYCRMKKRSGGMDIKTRTHSPYERTSHMDRSRYTDQVNPDPTSPPPVYSTLDRSFVAAPTRTNSDLTAQSIEMTSYRRESEQHLIPLSNERDRQFQVIPNPVPQPYQKAVSSTENLDKMGVGPPSGYNITNIGVGRKGSVPNGTNQQVGSRRVTLGSAPQGEYSSVNPLNARRTVSETTPVSSMPGAPDMPQYEVINTRANPTHANSSSKIHSGRVTSAGVARPPPAGPIQRYKSDFVGGGKGNSSVSKFEPYNEEDYENLDQPSSAGPLLKDVRPGPGWARGGQPKSAKGSTLPSGFSMSSTTVGGHRPASRQVSLPEKRVSISSYSRGSPANSRTSVTSMNKLKSPTDETAPPTYRDVILSDSSMIDNDAYQSTAEAAQQVGLQHHVVQNPRSSEAAQERYWFNDSNPNPRENIAFQDSKPSNSRLNLTPYSQVTNEQIDARTAEENSPQFFRNSRNFSRKEPTPYAEPVSSVEDLTKVGGNAAPKLGHSSMVSAV